MPQWNNVDPVRLARRGPYVAKLYARGHVFACRQCCGLAYESQSESPLDRSIWRARTIHLRLGGGPSIIDPFPDKPPRMHWRTYGRRFNGAVAVRERWIALSRDHLRRHYPVLCVTRTSLAYRAADS